MGCYGFEIGMYHFFVRNKFKLRLYQNLQDACRKGCDIKYGQREVRDRTKQARTGFSVGSPA